MSDAMSPAVKDAFDIVEEEFNAGHVPAAGRAKNRRTEFKLVQ